MNVHRSHRNLQGTGLLFTCVLCLTIVASAAGAPVITSVMPDKAGSAANITLTLHGSGFEPGAEIVLTPVNISPVIVGITPERPQDNLVASPMALVVSGNYVYANGPANSLEIINVTDPKNPVHAASFRTIANVVDIAITGHYAYVTGANVLEIIDITDPAKPVFTGFISSDTSDSVIQEAFGVGVSNNHAYVASVLTDTVEVFDVSNRSKPVFRARITNRDFGARLKNINNLYVSGKYVYASSAASNAVEIIDITNPVMPDHLGSLRNGTGGALLKTPSSIYARGKFAYVTSYGDNALEIINISDPKQPAHEGSLRDGETGAWLRDPYGVITAGNYAFVGTDKTLEIIDVTDPATPFHKFSTNAMKNSEPSYGPRKAFDISDGYAYLISTERITNGSPYNVDLKNSLEILDLGFIPTANVSVAGPESARCTINPAGRAPGRYNVVVTNPDGQMSVIAGAFEIMEPERNSTPIPSQNLPGTTPTAGEILPWAAVTGIAGALIIIRRFS